MTRQTRHIACQCQITLRKGVIAFFFFFNDCRLMANQALENLQEFVRTNYSNDWDLRIRVGDAVALNKLAEYNDEDE